MKDFASWGCLLTKNDSLLTKHYKEIKTDCVIKNPYFIHIKVKVLSSLNLNFDVMKLKSNSY